MCHQQSLPLPPLYEHFSFPIHDGVDLYQANRNDELDFIKRNLTIQRKCKVHITVIKRRISVTI
jgi:hypothetical protein